MIANVFCYVLGQYEDYRLESQQLSGGGRRAPIIIQTQQQKRHGEAEPAAVQLPNTFFEYYQQQIPKAFYDDPDDYQPGSDYQANEQRPRLARQYDDEDPLRHQHL